MTKPVRPSTSACFVAASALTLLQAGCTSALTASYLRDGLWESSSHAAPADSRADATEQPDAPAPEPAAAETVSHSESDRERREAALAEAMTRLSRMGALDPAVEVALVATLQRTQPEDWPVVVDEFAASLAASGPGPISAPAPAATVADAIERSTREPVLAAASPAESTAADDTVVPPATPAESRSPPVGRAGTADAAAPAETASPVEPATVPTAPALAVHTACFASAVRAWGDVDRFAADRFRPGQEVIVYLELDHLTSSESPSGHTTCIDTALKLVDESGRTIHAWTFDPVAETCIGRRRDYFARYVLRLPDSAPSESCRIEVAVTDTLAGATAAATLPLEIATGP